MKWQRMQMKEMEALFERLETAGQLPTPPSVVVRLLELTRQPDVSSRQVADTIAMDPALAAKILRFVNSPLAGMPRGVTSLQQAVALVGMRGVNMMALSFSVLSSPGAKHCENFDSGQFALQSLACGITAKALSASTRLGSPQETFVAGLLSQIGRLTLASALPDDYAEVLSRARHVPQELPELELPALGTTYTAVGAWLLRKWRIPETLCRAVETFRDIDGNPDVPILAKFLHVAEQAAGVICPGAQNEPPGAGLFIEAAGHVLALDAEQCLALINDVAGEIENVRQLLEFPEARVRPVQDIEAEVRERLAELSMAMHLENRSMAVQKEELLRRATTDALTMVGNRAAFDARMSLELERAARSGTPFAMLMIDVDKFKHLNDTHGHQAGDCVLQAIARLLDQSVRKVDYVARYGGEEFAVIAPSTPERGVAQLAERLRTSVESLRIPWERSMLNITISIGAAVFSEIADAADAPLIIKAADAQLYAAKCAGRNRVEIMADPTPQGCVTRKC